MTIGFRATDEDDEAETPPNVVDGRAEARELSPSEHCDLFVQLCVRLRAMGATEVRANEYRATFPPQLPQRAMPASAREPRQTKSDDDKIPRLDGDTAEDDARRERYRETARIIAG